MMNEGQEVSGVAPRNSLKWVIIIFVVLVVILFLIYFIAKYPMLLWVLVVGVGLFVLKWLERVRTKVKF
jgi:Flp pilus assembly protein TadB